jgi:hypothetical protein
MTASERPDATPHIIMLVLSQVDRLDDVLSAWRAIGIPGATIIESTGIYARERHRHIPARFFFSAGGRGDAERGQFTLFAVVCDESFVERCLEATEEVIGDLNNPNTGMYVAWPVSHAKGITRSGACEGSGA